MILTTAQLQALRDAIAADGALSVLPHNSDSADTIANAFNVTAAVAYWVWRSFVADSEMYEATSADATTWSWTIYIARSQGERDAWRQMVNMKGGINASLASVRAAVADIFSGAGGAAQRTHLLALGRRLTTRAEKLFATGTGSTASPGTMGSEGNVTIQNVIDAWNS